MPLFAYEARDAEGHRMKGTMDAASPVEVHRTLREQGYRVVSCIPVEQQVSLSTTTFRYAFSPLSPERLSLLYRQLATGLSAGVSPYEVVRTLVNTASDAKVRQVFRKLTQSVVEGVSLSKAMSQHGWLFPQWVVGMVHAGERGGFIDRSLAYIADYYERIADAQRYTRWIRLYLSIVLVGCVLVAPFPRFLLHGIDWYVGILFKYLLPALIAGWLCMRIMRALLRHPQVNNRWLEIGFLIPGYRHVLRGWICARFSQTVSHLLEAGIPITEAINVASDVIDVPTLRRNMKDITTQLRQGKPLTPLVSTVGLFNADELSLLQAGEKAGTLASSFQHIATLCNSDADDMNRKMVWAQTALAYLLMAVCVAFAVGYAWKNFYEAIYEVIEREFSV